MSKARDLVDNMRGVSSNIQTALSGKTGSVLEDTTPQLGGGLDLNGFDIPVSTTQQTAIDSAISNIPESNAISMSIVFGS